MPAPPSPSLLATWKSLDHLRVKEFKQAIEAARGLDASAMKLIQAGKVLANDDSTLEAAGVKDLGSHPGSFVVVMVSKKPAAAAAPAGASVPPPPVPGGAAAPAPSTASAPAPAAPSAPVATATGSSAGAGGANPFAGPEYDANLASLKAMGLAGGEETAYSNALIAAFNDPNRAVEYLLSGIPPGALERARGSGGAARAGGPRASAGAGAATAGGAPAGPAIPAGAHPSTLPGAPLFELRAHPQLNELKTAVQSNPQLISGIIDAIGKASADMAARIEANKDGFLSLMNEAIGAPGAAAGAVGADAGMGEEEGDFDEEGDDEAGGMEGSA